MGKTVYIGTKSHSLNNATDLDLESLIHHSRGL
jgi:hypothetical protein